MSILRRTQGPLQLVEEIQALLASGTSVDVRVRCKDHQPSDGLGAHKLVLASTSRFLKEALLASPLEDGLLCLHLPDYTSQEVGPVLSLLYYGEIWLTEDYASVCQSILDDLQISVRLTKEPDFVLVKRQDIQPKDIRRVRVKREPSTSVSDLHHEQALAATRVKCKVEAFETSELARNLKKEAVVEEPHHSDSDLIARTARNIKLEPPDDNDETASEVNTISAAPTPPEPNRPKKKAKVTCSTPGCSFSTSSLSSLQAHRVVHGRRSEKLRLARICPICHFEGKAPRFMRMHCIETHFKLELFTLKCIVEPNCNWETVLVEYGADRRVMDHLNQCHVRNNNDDNVVKPEENDECQPPLPPQPSNSSSSLLLCDFPGCSYSTSKSFNLTTHLRVHNDERQHECPICQKSFRSSSHMRDHTRAVHTKERSHQCSFCSRSFATRWQVQSHEQRRHPDGAGGKTKSYTCQICHQEFLSAPSYAGHIKSAHKTSSDKKSSAVDSATKSPKGVCETCGESLLKSGDKNHKCPALQQQSSQNDDNANLSECSICKKMIESKSVKAHMQYHKKKQSTSYTCHFCNKHFTTAISLKRHTLIHQNEKPFSCEICEKTFRQKVALKSHERVHSGQRFECENCSKKFITKSLLNQHLKSGKNCVAKTTK